MALWLQQGWGSVKPPVGIGINWGHPLAAGLVGCWLFNEGGGTSCYDATLLHGPGSLAASASFDIGKLGQALHTDGTTNSYATLKSGAILGGNYAWTIVAQLATTASPTNAAIYSEHATGLTDYVKLQINKPSSTVVASLVYENDAGTVLTVNGSKAINDGKPHVLAATKSGTALKVYVDGKQDGSGTFGSSSDSFTNSGVQSRVMADNNTTNRLAGELGFLYLYTRALSASDIEWLYEEYYAFLTAIEYGSWMAAVTSALLFRRSLNSRCGARSPERVVLG